jgi:Carboxypeptidase regulatory-like domain
VRRKLTLGILAIALQGICALAQGPTKSTGTVHGTVFIVDDDGGRSVIPSVKVSLTGPTHIEVQSDDAGSFSFDPVIPGDYTISAEAPGMAGTQNIVVGSAAVSEVSLQMKLVVLAQSTTVTASADQADAKEPSGTSTVGESALRNMPRSARFYSVSHCVCQRIILVGSGGRSPLLYCGSFRRNGRNVGAR